MAVYDAVGKGVRQLKVFRSHPPPMVALSLDQFMWMMMMMMIVMILMTIDDSDDLYSRTCMSVCSLPISSSLGARTASEIFCQITQFKEQPSSSSSSSMIWVHIEPQSHCNVVYHLRHFSKIYSQHWKTGVSKRKSF